MSTNTVELVGHYGSDETHALSAWTSTSRELTDAKRERMGALLKMLAQSDPPHTTPFEKSTLHFLVRCDTASHIHLLKHRAGVSINGESARYKELQEPTMFIPDDWPDWVMDLVAPALDQLPVLYHALVMSLEPTLGRKRAKESARFVLPYANQLTLDVTFNFNSFMHFYRLRADEGAQKEIHGIADAMLYLVRETGDFDLSLEAFGV